VRRFLVRLARVQMQSFDFSSDTQTRLYALGRLAAIRA
jgi:hypothetical protein